MSDQEQTVRVPCAGRMTVGEYVVAQHYVNRDGRVKKLIRLIDGEVARRFGAIAARVAELEDENRELRAQLREQERNPALTPAPSRGKE